MTDGLPEQVQRGTGGPRPGVVLLDPAAVGYAPVLGGPPQTATMHAGSVVLQPAEAVGAHTTGEYEEVLVVLSGTGEMRLADGTVLRLAAHCVAYCPPATEHDVVNTGIAPLRYVYVVARAPGT